LRKQAKQSSAGMSELEPYETCSSGGEAQHVAEPKQTQDGLAEGAPGPVPKVVSEERALLKVVIGKLDRVREPKPRTRSRPDDLGAMIELRDALAEAKPEDQASLLEQMHRIESLSRQRGKGEQPPVDRKSPYFGHLRLEEDDKRRDVLIGQRGFVEPGGGVQIVDWRNAPVSRLFYRYEEGDYYEEKLGNRIVEGEVVARRTVTIMDSELRRVTSPDGTFARDGSGRWREIDSQSARLQVQRDGTATLVNRKADQSSAGGRRGQRSGRLGTDGAGRGRQDKFLPSIAALIDPRQFELISRPTSGLIVVQGSAGSGKTTIGLHRIAYLAFQDGRRFRPQNMLVVVYQKALATYVSRVLPSLEVPGVPVMTFAGWAEKIRNQVLPELPGPLCDNTPALVIRAKSHGALLHIVEDRQRALADWCREQIETRTAARPSLCTQLLNAWDESKGPVDARVSTLARFVRDAGFEPAARTLAESLGRALRVRTRDVVGEWAGFLTDRQALGAGFAKYAPGAFSEGQLDSIHSWCVERERLRLNHLDDPAFDEPYGLDAEDDALLLRVFQLQRGQLATRSGTIAYEHLMVDEVQDFAPIELAVLLESTTKQRCVTLAGDTAQAIAPEHGFSRWSDMLDDLGIPHDRVEPLRVSYRSTRQIVECAEHVLGPLGGDKRPVAPRSGAPVEAFGFGSSGEANEFLGRALKDLMRTDPSASVALITRHPEQARLYYEGLRKAEVPRLRLVRNQDFSFVPGIDVTDVRQTKGLEFDIVIVLEATAESYPVDDHARRLLHVAMTRGAHQLWVTYTARPSDLLPETLRY